MYELARSWDEVLGTRHALRERLQRAVTQPFHAGLAFLVAFIVTFCLFLLYSAFVPPALGRSRVFWGGLATVFVAILAFRSVQTTGFDDGRDEWMKDPPIIIESPGGVGEVAPPSSPTTGSQPSQRSKE